MTELTRRSFTQIAGAVAAAAGVGAPSLALANAPKVVVIGGGAAGATVAKYVARDSKGKIDVTLVETNKHYVTCFYSNLYLGGFRSFQSITHSYDKLVSNYGVKFANATATAIDTNAKTVTLHDGTKLRYDRLVVAPGIDFKKVEGLSEADQHSKILHAYKAGPQTQLLRAQLLSMRKGGTFILCAPDNPFRCPPGPYERVSMVANYLKKNNPTAKVLVLDAKDKFSKEGLFKEAWSRFYPGMVEWLGKDFTGGGVASVDVAGMSVKTKDGTVHKGDVINLIPNQTAGRIAIDSGLCGTGDWAPIVPSTLLSKVAPDVHVLGDACANGDMPKSGFSANSQAKVVANAIRAALIGDQAFPPRFRNTCWSLVSDNHSVKVGANYEANDAEGKIKTLDSFVSKTGEDDKLRAATAAEADDWYVGMTNDMFA